MRVAQVAAEKKALDLSVLEVGAVTSYTDYCVICSGRSDRQVQAITQAVADTLSAEGRKPIGVEGLTQGHWVLMDLGSVVLHVFYEPVREFYDLDGHWADAPRVELPPEWMESSAQEPGF
jgi:ribosome-associated protein